MAEIQIRPSVTNLSAAGDIQLLYEAIDFPDSATTVSFPLAIFFNSNEVPLADAQVSGLPDGTSIASDQTISDDNNGDSSDETDSIRLLNLDGLPVNVEGEQNFVTLPITFADTFDGSVVNFAFGGNPSNFGFEVPAIDGVSLGEDVPATPSVELSIEPTEGAEGDSFTLTATASEAVTGEQTVGLALSGDADAADFEGDLPTAINIADGETTGTVEVTVADDDVEEGEETANFALENPPEGFVLGANTDVDITIEDNDSDAPPTELQGDFNDDGITNLDDLGLFAAAFGSAEGDANYNPAVELTGDNLINDDDLSPLATFFTQEFVVA